MSTSFALGNFMNLGGKVIAVSITGAQLAGSVALLTGLMFSLSGKGPLDRRNNQSQNKETDYLKKKYKVGHKIWEQFHREITRKRYTKQVLEEILKELLGL